MWKEGKSMKKGKEWLKEAVGELNLVDTVFESDGVSYIDTAVSVMQVYDLIEQLDEPEVLSQEWIEEHTYYEDEYDFYYADPDELKNLLVQKHEELESKIKVLIEAYKQEDGAYSNPENGWISGFVEDLENLVEEEQKYYALVKGHELVTNEGDLACKYWKFDTYNGDLFISNQFSRYGRCLNEMSKEDWNDLGINHSNADFVKVEEMEE